MRGYCSLTPFTLLLALEQQLFLYTADNCTESEGRPMYCPYCGVDHEDSRTLRSIEHVIPYGLGGSDDLTISTCDKSNNDLGSEVDAPFMESFPVRAKRFFLGLESNKGNAPTLDLGGIGWIDGKEVPISYVISSETKELKIAKPNIIKTANDDGTEHWQVSGDPAQAREILEGKLRKQLALGKTITFEDGSLLRLEDLDRIFAERTKTVINPSVLGTIQHDYLDYIRFFSKLALAMGHLHLGESFSRSITGDRLRQNLKAQTMEDVVHPGHIWPEIELVQGVLKMIEKEKHHTLVVMEGEVPVLLVSLFGEIGAVIPLGEAPTGRLPKFSDKGAVWRIALPSRALSKLTVLEMIEERLPPLRKTERVVS